MINKKHYLRTLNKLIVQKNKNKIKNRLKMGIKFRN